MIYNLPNINIALPSAHILSPRFYSMTPSMPTHHSLFLPYDHTSFAGRTHTHHSVDPSSRNPLESSKKSNNPISLRALEWTIGRFELSLKQLFVSLHLWCNDDLTAPQVSDVFVRLATDYNATIAMLESYDIFVFELCSFEQRLREVLEPCLNEPAVPESFYQCISAIEAILKDTLPRLASKHTAVKQMLL